MRESDPWTATSDPLGAKLQIPLASRYPVLRSAILHRLRAEKRQPIVSIVAPAGYGKTSVLAQWARADDRPAAWLTVDQGDNDAASFLNLLTAALSRVVPVDPTIPVAIASRSVQPRDVIGRLLAALTAHGGPLLVAIDNSHRLTDMACLDALAEFINYMPGQVQVAVAGREPMRLPFDRWRLEGRMVEIGVDELALDEREAVALARQFEVRLTSEVARRLTMHTAGWPALTALASMSMRRIGRADLDQPADLGALVTDYLRAELLEHRPIADIEFMTRASVLESLTGPVCDAVLDRDGSGVLLETFARSTLLIDDYSGSFRYHAILRKFLLRELERREPGLAPVLHRRAAVWYEAAGHTDLAVEHAFQSGDVELVANLVGRHFFRYHWTGRRAILLAWLQRLGDDALMQRPWLLLLAAWEATSAGDVGASERYAAMAERASFEGPPPDGTASLESGRAILRAGQARRGAAAMLADATFAVEQEGPGSPWYGFGLVHLYLARRICGDARGAEEALAHARMAVQGGGDPGFGSLVLGYCANSAMDRGDWDMASRFVDEAVTLGAGRFDGYPSYAEVRVAIARMLLHDGDVRAVRRELAKAAILRPALTAAAPVIALTALLGLARLHLAVADPAGAKAVLTQAGDILRRRTDLGTLPVQVAELRATVTGLPVGLAGASALTTAELRVLQLLPYYLSFKEIAQRLGVKATTIKTHALSIYGKLGASSRGEAVEVAVEAGLLEWFTGFGHPSTDAPEMARVLGDDIDAALEELDPS